MDYPLEALGPDRFQRLCQALLAREFPGVRCFPVGQADGGRDVVAPSADAVGAFIVYQIKFTRDALLVTDPHKWVLRALDDEKHKIPKLVSKGASRYVVITNVRGTGPLERGSIDKADSILSEATNVPTSCWWRDDIERRLDNDWNLKWSYPDLLTGTDLVRYFIEQRLREHEERRSAALRTFLADQYASDREVKFRQVELQNDLFSLYVDVPVAPLNIHAQQEKTPRHVRAYYHLRSRIKSEKRASNIERATSTQNEHGDLSVGAARLLLDDHFALESPRIVLEGAPGQGKSTVTQYVCQAHRVRLLSIPASLHVHHTQVPLRLPFRVDLRDFATWLQQRDPFSPDTPTLDTQWNRSLESFLAALVRHHSGGAVFDVSDLHAILTVSAVLFAFDGLDEVADITRRFEVVDELQRGVSRLSSVAVSLQVIVTSRPAAFTNSPGLPEQRFPPFHLTSLPRDVVETYADKWLDARRLTGKPRADVNRILRSKLDQPHLRDLAKNPMQLAILLSLILSKGSALPDKRTALYDAYVGLFFDREAEKSDVVRDNRDLLVDIHRYLAFLLHRDSELGGTGAMAEDELRSVVQRYLLQEGYDAGLANALFKGMVERVVALVSRVEGTYEFEVQPLREYFAARFLADTAPLSPPGNEQRGTKPDRFDAVARNFYWQNVTRFYAGCFGKGELLALSDRVLHLLSDGDFSLISYPKLLATTLLSDWVFFQSPKAVAEIVGAIVDRKAVRYLATVPRSRRASQGVVLADGCGRRELVEHCLKMLVDGVQKDITNLIVDLLRSNASPTELLSRMEAVALVIAPARRISLLKHAHSLSVLSRWPRPSLEATFADDLNDTRALDALLSAGRYDVLHRDAATSKAILDAVLNRDANPPLRRDPVSRLDVLARLHSTRLYEAAARRNDLGRLRDDKYLIDRSDPYAPDTSLDANNAFGDRIDRFLQEVVPTLEQSASAWGSQLGLWENLIESSRRTFGDHWAHFEIATASSAIVTDDQRGHEELFNASTSLCRRAGYATTVANRAGWWKTQLSLASGDFDVAFWLLLLVANGSSQLLLRLAADINDAVESLDVKMWRRLEGGFRRSGGRQFRSSEVVLRLPDSMSQRGVVVFGHCFNSPGQLALYRRFLRVYDGGDSAVWNLCMRVGMRLLTDAGHSEEALEIVRQAYARGAATGVISFGAHLRRNGTVMSTELSRTIALRADEYPLALLSLAESVLRESIAERVEPVGQTATREGWLQG